MAFRPPRLPALAAGILSASLACTSPGPPESVVTAHGIVRGGDRARTLEVAGWLEEVYPRVVALLPGARPQPAEVWLMPSLPDQATSRGGGLAEGVTWFDWEDNPARIQLLAEGRNLRFILSHELAHALLGPSWRTIPGALAEGMSDLLAAWINPDLAPAIRADRLVRASAYTGGLRLRLVGNLGRLHPGRPGPLETGTWLLVSTTGSTPAMELEELLALGFSDLNTRRRSESLPDYYGVGFVLATRIAERQGLEGILALCTRARDLGHEVVPPSWVLRAAHLEDPARWQETFDRMLGKEELRALIRENPELLVGAAVGYFGPSQRRLGGEEFLARVRPRIQNRNGDTVLLAEIPAARQALLSLWAERYGAAGATEAP